MNLLHAIILGIIQGLTEFIPISSSGHLIIAEKLMGLETQNGMTAEQITAFIAVMQLGTLAAVLIYFFRDIINISIGFIKDNIRLIGATKDTSGQKGARLGWMIII